MEIQLVKEIVFVPPYSYIIAGVLLFVLGILTIKLLKK